jgi:predicted transposase/invertase (TIGR01784 family)
MIDLNLIEKGQSYNVLNKSYVIFICMSDIFGKGRHIYTFENVCLQDRELTLGDETTKVFLNPYSDMDDVDEELRNFLKFLADGTVSDNFTQALSEEAINAKQNKKWRREYMTLYMIEQEAREEGFAQCRADFIRKMLAKGYTSAEIADILELDEDFIENIQSETL